jgi:quercetin dioxygenase-like cupin family protein
MKNSTYLIMSVLLVNLVSVFATQSAMAQDVVKVAPDVKILLENDQVRVLESTLKPGEIEPMHSHPAYIAYFLTPTTVKITTPDGKSSVKKPKAGKVLYGDGATHEIENIGNTLQRVLVIELKK